MKVQIASLSLHGPVLVGEFLGLYSDEYDDTSVVVRLPGNGLYLDVIHPSRVTFVETPTECPSCLRPLTPKD